MQQIHHPFQIFYIRFVERGELIAVDVEDGDDLAVLEYGNDNLAAGGGRAGDVSGELLDVGYHNRALFLPRRAAHPAPVRDARTGQRPLERTEHQLVTDDAVEARPPEPERFVQHRRHVRHVRDDIHAAVHHRLHLREEGGVFFLLAVA